MLRDRGLLQESDASFREAIRLLHLPDLDTGQQVALTEVLFSRLLVKRRAFAEAEEVLERSIRELRLFYEGRSSRDRIACRTSASSVAGTL